MPKRTRGIGLYLAIFIALMLIATMAYSNLNSPTPTRKYSEVVGYFQRGIVREYTIDLDSSILTITKMDGANAPITYRVPNINLFMNDVHSIVVEYNAENPNNPINFEIKPAQSFPWWVSMLPSLLLIGIMIVFWVLMMRQTRGGGGNVSGFGKAKARTSQDGRRITFGDVAALEEEKEELLEIVDFLRSPAKFNSLGARIPKGVLMVGPPGTGKTYLARAVAGEADVQFFSISGSDFVEMFVGVGASRVRDLFDQAKKNAPSVVFIDEIDAVGRQRGAGLGGGHDEREQTLNQLLVEMDGFSANTGVIIMAATNRRDILDPALLRPGRFDRQVVVGYPDIKGREAILKIHCRNKPLAPDVVLKTIAKTTAGFTPADLENLVNEAALLSARKDLKAITMKEIEEATIKVVAGPEKKSHVVTDKDKKIVAYHEAGHAMCHYYCKTLDPVHQVSIVPRGMAGGYTMSLPSEDNNFMTKTRMYESIVSLMGGRVAEQLVLDDITTGASNDMERTTKIARSMVTRYGFNENIGPVVYGSDHSEVFLGRDYTSSRDFSEEVAAEIDKEIRVLIDKAYKETMKIIGNNIGQLHAVAKYLFENEKIDGDQFIDIMEGRLAVEGDPFERIGTDKENKEHSGELSDAPVVPPIVEGPKMEPPARDGPMQGDQADQTDSGPNSPD